MTLTQTIFDQHTLFALFVYGLSIVIVLPIFVFIHDKLDNNFLQLCWDKIGMPLIRTFLLIGFILLIYPINFGLDAAPSINELLSVDDKRSSFLINMIFLLTFIFPFIPLLGKLDEFTIPLQGILCSMIIFSWLCQGLNIQDYSLFPDFKVLALIIFMSVATHWLAKHVSEYTGDYLNKLFHREGFKTLSFKAFVLIMQCPVIFIFGIYLGKQIP
jgi:type III secretory pathway component EscS